MPFSSYCNGALEAALDCHNLDADVLMATDHERELLTPGVRDTQFILGMHPQPLPKVLSLLSLLMAHGLVFAILKHGVMANMWQTVVLLFLRHLEKAA